MNLLKRMAIPLLILITAVAYWFLSSYEPAGSVLLLIFAIAAVSPFPLWGLVAVAAKT